MTDTWTIIGTVATITLGAVGGSTWHLKNEFNNLITADVTLTEKRWNFCHQLHAVGVCKALIMRVWGDCK